MAETAREKAEEAATEYVIQQKGDDIIRAIKAAAARDASDVWEPIACETFRMVGSPWEWDRDHWSATCRFCREKRKMNDLIIDLPRGRGTAAPDNEGLHAADCRWLRIAILLGRHVRYERCGPSLLHRHPTICRDQPHGDPRRRVVGERDDGTCDFHEHLVEVR